MLGGQAVKPAAKNVQRFRAARADARAKNAAALLGEKQHRGQAPPGVQHRAEQVIQCDRLHCGNVFTELQPHGAKNLAKLERLR